MTSVFGVRFGLLLRIQCGNSRQNWFGKIGEFIENSRQNWFGKIGEFLGNENLTNQYNDCFPNPVKIFSEPVGTGGPGPKVKGWDGFLQTLKLKIKCPTLNY